MHDRRFALVVCFALGWWLASSPSSPIRPDPPRPDRPVLTAVGRLAKFAARWGLWVTLVGEDAPVAESVRHPEERQGIVQGKPVDAAGHPILNHREGW
jgi:hypothetical protein